mgnify:CR=1 FL=1
MSGKKLMDARTTALNALIATRRQGAWSDGILKERIAKDGLDRRDAALASQLAYGVMQNRLLLDHYLEQTVTRGLAKLQPVTQDILRLGAYQILFLDKIPDSAAVNQAVEQTKRYVSERAAGLTNGALRALVRGKNTLKAPKDLATKYSHPQALVELLRENLGDGELEAFLKADNEPVPTCLQVNTLLANAEQAEAAFTALDIPFARHPWLPGCYLVKGTGDLAGLELFKNGQVYVQDPSARLAAMAAGVKPGMDVLDVCAAPGGKSFAAAIAMENRGSVTSCDIHEHKISLIEKGAERLGIRILHAQQADASKFREDFENRFDAVIADVPCSGLGVIRKKPDIRYKDLSPTERLPAVQAAILENVSRYVKPGGVLVYSTCTILKRENEAVALAFLKAHPDFSLEPFEVPEKLDAKNDGMLTLLPHRHDADGFFICRMRKNA